MAAGTRDREAEEGCQNVDPVVEPVRLVLADVDGRVDFLAQEPEASAENRFVEPFGGMATGFRKQIAGDMFVNEAVVGYVRIQLRMT